MQAEIDRLRVQLARTGGSGDGTASLDPAAAAELQQLKELLAEQKANEEALREDMARQLQKVNETKEERQAAAAAINQQWATALGGATMEKKEDISVPHLLNLNPEERLAETLIYKLKDGSTVAGRANKEHPPDLEFSGMGMLKEHCEFQWNAEAKTVVLVPKANGARALVNGVQLTGPTPLKHNDRVWLGNNYAFRFAFPGKEEDTHPLPEGVKPDYYQAETEIAEQTAKSAGEGGAEVTALNSKLSEALKKVEQANIVASDLHSGAIFQPKIITNRDNGENQIVVNVQLPHANLTWPWGKFDVRLVEMIKLWEAWQYASNNNQIFELPKEETANPFIDKEYQLIGEADVWLKSIANMIDVDLNTQILSVSGVKEGVVLGAVVPLDAKGEEGPWDDDRADLDPFVENPEELLNKEIQFAVKLQGVQFDADLSRGGRAKYHDTWIRYRVHESEAWTETAHDARTTLTPAYNSSTKFKYVVDNEMLKMLKQGKIVLQVWGKLVDDKPISLAGTVSQLVPEGWKRVQAWQDPQGGLHLELPKAK